jgi:hypothetical protein
MVNYKTLVLDYVRDHPGSTVSEIAAGAGCMSTRARQILNDAVAAGGVTRRKLPGGPWTWQAAGLPEAPLEIRERRDDQDEALPFLTPAARLTLPQVLHVAETCGRTVDVTAGGRYLVSYCGASPYWWPDNDGGMHQVGSHGWCHDCHKEGLGYVHHLDYQVELAVLENEARHDRVLAERCEADGLTPARYAAETAGRAVPLRGDSSFATAVRELGVNADGEAVFGVAMWDMRCWKVAVPLAPGAPEAAARLAEKLAYEQEPDQCVHLQGHARPLRPVRGAPTGEAGARAPGPVRGR